MSKHEELIERLRASSETGLDPDAAYAAADALEAQAREIEGLHAARQAYASEFPPDNEGEPDVGSIHQNIRAMKAEIEGLRKDAERLDWLEQNIFHREMDEWDSKIGGRGNQSMWVLFAPKGLQGSARNIIDAAKGAPHG